MGIEMAQTPDVSQTHIHTHTNKKTQRETMEPREEGLPKGGAGSSQGRRYMRLTIPLVHGMDTSAIQEE